MRVLRTCHVLGCVTAELHPLTLHRAGIAVPRPFLARHANARAPVESVTDV